MYKIRSRVLSVISDYLKPIEEIKNTGKALVGGTVYRFKLIGALINANTPKYDFKKIRQVYRRFGFIRQALAVYKHRATSELPDIVCDNVSARNILMQRLEFMKIFEHLPNMFQDLTVFGNVFYEIIFDEEEIPETKKLTLEIEESKGILIEGNENIRNKAKRLKRIVGIKRLEPDYMKIVQDEFGRTRYYINTRDDVNLVVLEYWRVIHIKLDSLPGDAFGIGLIEGAIDDIAALRMVEDLQLQLIKHDIYPFRVFTCPSNEVIEEIEAKLSEQERFGDLVVPGDVKMQQSRVGNASQDLRALMTFYKEKIFMDLGVPMQMLIEGSKTNKACYSEDTQTLTNNGWKYYWEIKDDDLIATFNPENRIMEFHKPIGGIYLYDHDGEMLHFKNRYIDILVTPNHRMYCKEFRSSEFEVIRAEDIKWDRFSFNCKTNWDSCDEDSFILKEVKYEKSYKSKNVGDRKIKMDKWLEFLGYVLSEGCIISCPSVENEYGIHISQKKDDIKIKIKKLMDSMTEFNVIEKPHGEDPDALLWYIYDKSLHTYLTENIGSNSHNKKIPSFYRNLSQRQLRILFNALMDGDGSVDKRENGTAMCYYTSSVELADNVQEIAIKLGYYATISSGSRCLRVLISERDDIQIYKKSIYKENYKGKVYCYEVPNHLFFTRRNGKVTIQGNTAGVQSDAFNFNVYAFINQVYIPMERLSKLILLFEGIDSNVTWNYKDIDRGAEQSLREEVVEWFEQGIIDREDALELLDNYGGFRYLNIKARNKLIKKGKITQESSEVPALDLPGSGGDVPTPELGDRIADDATIDKPQRIIDRIKEKVTKPDGTRVEKTTERIKQVLNFAEELRDKIVESKVDSDEIFDNIKNIVLQNLREDEIDGQYADFIDDIGACIDLYNNDKNDEQFEYLVSKSCAKFSRDTLGRFEG